MSQYILTDEFQELEETSGTVVNASDVKVELSEVPEFNTGVILHPRKKLSFSNKLYAARAPSDCGVAVIGVLVGNDSVIVVQGGGSDSIEHITYNDIAKLFGADSGTSGDGYITDDEPDEFTDYLNDLFGD